MTADICPVRDDAQPHIFEQDDLCVFCHAKRRTYHLRDVTPPPGLTDTRYAELVEKFGPLPPSRLSR
jgi:hypothetical protein